MRHSHEQQRALEIRDLTVEQGGAQVVHNVDLNLPQGEVRAVLGSNGAGKSSLVDAICGLARKRSGTVSFFGQDITSLRANRIARYGLIQVSQDRDLFPTMTVHENLELGVFAGRGREERPGTSVAEILNAFPILADRSAQLAGSLSGGEQQMLAIGRALASRPEVLILDEPTAGLAPVIVQGLVKSIIQMSNQGMTMLVVEQNVQVALDTAETVLVLRRGEAVFDGPISELGESPREALTEFYV